MGKFDSVTSFLINPPYDIATQTHNELIRMSCSNGFLNIFGEKDESGIARHVPQTFHYFHT